MTLQNEVFEAYRTQVLEHKEENRAGANAMKTVIEQSPLSYNGVLEKTVHIPKVFDEETVAHFEEIVKTSCGIFGKVIQGYRKDETIRRLFPFSKELEELILLPKPYEGVLPISRLDIFYNEDTGGFRFCEINTDGTAAMFRDVELRKALACNPAHQAVEKMYVLEPFELFDSWVSTFLELYGTYDKKVENPHVAIVDFLENATYPEFKAFEEAFRRAGVSCKIYDIRTLQYKDGRLLSDDGALIDAVYRRAVTADIMSHYEEVSAFLTAVREDAVFFAGAFETQLIHTKWLFYVLHHPAMRRLLTQKEQDFVDAHVPKTVEFSAEYIDLVEVIRKKDDFILKPMDAYASKGVYAAGREYEQHNWDSLCRDLYGKGMICQQYCTQYMTPNIDFAWGDGEWHSLYQHAGALFLQWEVCRRADADGMRGKDYRCT